MELFVELFVANFLHTQLIQECNFQVQKVSYCSCSSSVVVFLGLLELRKDVSNDVFVHGSRLVMTILLIHKTGVRQKYTPTERVVLYLVMCFQTCWVFLCLFSWCQLLGKDCVTSSPAPSALHTTSNSHCVAIFEL